MSDMYEKTPEQRAYEKAHPDELGVLYRYVCEAHLGRFDGEAVAVPRENDGPTIVCPACAKEAGDDGTWERLPNGSRA